MDAKYIRSICKQPPVWHPRGTVSGKPWDPEWPPWTPDLEIRCGIDTAEVWVRDARHMLYPLRFTLRTQSGEVACIRLFAGSDRYLVSERVLLVPLPSPMEIHWTIDMDEEAVRYLREEYP